MEWSTVELSAITTSAGHIGGKTKQMKYSKIYTCNCLYQTNTKASYLKADYNLSKMLTKCCFCKACFPLQSRPGSACWLNTYSWYPKQVLLRWQENSKHIPQNNNLHVTWNWLSVTHYNSSCLRAKMADSEKKHW